MATGKKGLQQTHLWFYVHTRKLKQVLQVIGGAICVTIE